MDKKFLEEIGLTGSEVEVYFSLLGLGESTTGAILKVAKVSGGKIYQILDKLIGKGLVAFVVKNNVKRFYSTPPKRILDYFERKEKDFSDKKKKLEKEIEALESVEKNVQEDFVLLYQGFKGVETAVFRALEEFDSDEVLAMGVRFSKSEKFNLMWEKWHRLREKKKIKCRILLSEDKGGFLEKFKNTKVKFIGGVTPSAITILGDVVLIQNYGELVSCVYIQNEETAKSFRTFFESLWVGR